MKYAQVVVNTPLGVRKPLEEEKETAESRRERAFTYAIPEHLANKIALGQLLWVPFGSRRIQGVVIAFSETSPVEQTKDIDEIADARPLLSITQLELARWIARTYLCSLYDAISLMLPPGIEQPTEILLSLAPDISRNHLTPKQTALVDVLTRDGETKLNKLPRDLRSAVDVLAQRGSVIKKTIVTPLRAKPKRVNTVRLISEAGLAKLAVDSIPANILEYLAFADKGAEVNDLITEVKCTKKTLAALESQQLITVLPPRDLLIPLVSKRELQAVRRTIEANDSKVASAFLILRKHHGRLNFDALKQLAISHSIINALVKKGYAKINKKEQIKRSKLGTVNLAKGRRLEELLRPRARRMLTAIDFLRQSRSPVSYAEFSRQTNTTRTDINNLIARGYIRREKTKVTASLRVSPLEAVTQVAALRKPTRLVRIVEFLRAENKPVWVSAVYAAVENCSLQDLRKLEAAGVVALEEEEVWRDSLAGRMFDVVEPPKLTVEQEAAWAEIKSQIPTSNYQLPITFLLHGVTGSGKTEIYLRALAEILAQGKQGIVLVPEISLTPQTIRRFGARFPNRIAVVHSKLSEGERYDTWRRCRDGLVDVVIGARSALFAPLPRLGLIVLDEEHDPSYKQADLPLPGYHARAVALELAQRVGATVILGSATPDLETYYRATRGEFTLLELPKRVMGHRQVIENQISDFRFQISDSIVHELADHKDARYLELPPVEIVDLRAELKAGNRSMFSRALQREMARVLAAREQVILFLNRRGTATFIMCRDCGYVFKCKRCDNPMTYHGTGEQLVCHHCNRRDRVPTTCPQCSGARIRYFGVGTEKVEAEIQALFPKARTLRWDWDVTRGKTSHEEILEKFVHHQADILIGTQMIAKGLDLPLVTLVGVVSADTALNLPDFRSGERTFQLLTQVAGRAGRSILGGKVIIQTYNPEHYAIQAASSHDYRTFYDREIAFRHEQHYPPYSRLIRLLYAHANEKQAQIESTRMQRALATRIAQRGLPSLDLIGPAPAFFHRVRGEYRYQILVRGDAERPHALVQDIALPLGWRVDVDPVSVL